MSNPSLGFRHCDELQSLRGLAAYAVLVGHCFGIYFSSETVAGRVLSVPFNGNGSVVLFFVLSGFVLSGRFVRVRLTLAESYRYFVARFFRIHPLLVLATVLGTLYVNLWHVPNQFATSWYQGIYTQPIGLTSFISSAIGFGGRAAPPMWSIWVEIVGSSVLLILVFASYRRWYNRVLVCVILLFISFNFQGRFGWPVYLIDFFIGMSLHWWSGPFVACLNYRMRISTLVLAILLFLGSGAFFDVMSRPLFNIVEAVPAALIIAIIYHAQPGWLRHRYLVAGGNISYSVYLLHFILMAMFVSAYTVSTGGALVPWFVLVPATLVGSSVLAWLTFSYVEQPFIALGRRVNAALQFQEGRGGSDDDKVVS